MFVMAQIPCFNLHDILQVDNRDKKKELLADVKKKVSEWGFFHVKGHGVDMQILRDLRSWSAKYFDLPLEEKLSCHKDRFNPGNGLLCVADSNNFSCSLAEHISVNGIGEPFKRELMENYCKAMSKLSKEVMELLEDALEVPDNAFSKVCENRHAHHVRFNNWVPPYVDDPSHGFHTDSTVIGILHQDVSGLEILKDGKRIIFEADPEAFLVNVGDYLQVLSNDTLPSVYHRGASHSELRRISVIYFEYSSPQQVLNPVADEQHPAKFKPMTTKEFIDAIFAHTDHFLANKRVLDTFRLSGV